MKLQIVSDLHNEFGHEIKIPNTGANVLVLSGDIDTARDIKYRQDESLPFFEQVSDGFKDVVYVAGNHEFYHGNIDTDYENIRDVLSKFPNIHFLQDEYKVIQGIPFFGATLWTDFNKNCPNTSNTFRDYMNDYRLISSRGSSRFLPSDVYNRHKASLICLEKFCTEFKDYEVVVCTHHAPSNLSIHPKYKDGYYVNGCYSSDLSEIIIGSNIKLWTHGHTHHSFDYVIDNTRIVANPAGYPIGNKRENSEFDLTKVWET